MTTSELTPAAFVDAWLAAVAEVKSRDGWVGMEHMASRLGVDARELVAWCYAHAPEAGLEIQGVASRTALVRVASHPSELVRGLVGAALAVVIAGLLAVAGGLA
jgi:hypothetical protein